MARFVVAMAVQNEAETLARCVRSWYPHVDRALISTDPRRGWSGAPITPDGTVEILRELDVEGKFEIVEGDFYVHTDPMANETAQRQMMVDRLSAHLGPRDWILQLDADEELLDAPALLADLARQPVRTRSAYWAWVNLFGWFEDGRNLMIADVDGSPCLEAFPIAVRRGERLRYARHPFPPRWAKRSLVRRALGDGQYRGYAHAARGNPVLHHSYNKSPARIREKLATWGHSAEVDAEAFYQLWESAPTQWEQIRDFHPIEARKWPALRPFDPKQFKLRRDAAGVGSDE